jgi:hypothetical protein
MSDSGETTIQAGVAALVDLLRDEVQADPPTAGTPFRRVVEGPTGLTEHPRPFVSVHVVSTRVVGAVDGDKLVSVALVLRVVGDAIGAGAHAAMLQLVGAVEDAVESWEDDGVVAGVMGFEAWDWRMAPGESAGGVKAVSAEARVGIVVRVVRGANREVGV